MKLIQSPTHYDIFNTSEHFEFIFRLLATAYRKCPSVDYEMSCLVSMILIIFH